MLTGVLAAQALRLETLKSAPGRAEDAICERQTSSSRSATASRSSVKRWVYASRNETPVGDVHAAALREPDPHPVGRGRGDRPEHADRHTADEPHDAGQRREDPGPLALPLRRTARSIIPPTAPGSRVASPVRASQPAARPARRRPGYPAAMSVIDWLLDGDPAIRWQVLRDLGNASPDDVAADQARVEHDGWGAPPP